MSLYSNVEQFRTNESLTAPTYCSFIFYTMLNSQTTAEKEARKATRKKMLNTLKEEWELAMLKDTPKQVKKRLQKKMESSPEELMAMVKAKSGKLRMGYVNGEWCLTFTYHNKELKSQHPSLVEALATLLKSADHKEVEPQKAVAV